MIRSATGGRRSKFRTDLESQAGDLLRRHFRDFQPTAWCVTRGCLAGHPVDISVRAALTGVHNVSVRSVQTDADDASELRSGEFVPVWRPGWAVGVDGNALLISAVGARDVDVAIDDSGMGPVPLQALERDVSTVGRPARGVSVTNQSPGSLARNLDDPHVVVAYERELRLVPRPVWRTGVSNDARLLPFPEILHPEIIATDERNCLTARRPVNPPRVSNEEPT